MLSTLTGFIDELRACGVPVSMVEAIDAMRAVEVTQIESRAALRETLRATLVKNVRHQRAFETAFDVFFALTPSGEQDTSDGDSPPDGQGQPPDSVDPRPDNGLLEQLLKALEHLDRELLQRAVEQAVSQLAGIEPGRPVGGTYYLYRTMRRLDMAHVEAGLMAALTPSDGESQLEARLTAEEVQLRMDQLREAIQDEIRRRLVADRGREAVARTLRRSPVEDIDLMHATSSELVDMEAAIGPLTRKLAARLSRRRRRRMGRLDFRRTVRKSLATGGVPADPQYRHPRPHRPEVWLMADVSGSMATFSRFTLQFTHAMATHFSKLRTFAFVDTVDEVTDFFGTGIDFGAAIQRVGIEAEVVWLDGHSDYGNSLQVFLDRYGRQLDSRTTLIIAGDARNNYRPPRGAVFAELARRCRAVVWLNPEPRTYWDTGDSAMGHYAPHCTSVHEVRTLKQLEEFIEELTIPVGAHNR